MKEEDEAIALKQLDDDDLGRFVLFVLKVTLRPRTSYRYYNYYFQANPQLTIDSLPSP